MKDIEDTEDPRLSEGKLSLGHLIDSEKCPQWNHLKWEWDDRENMGLTIYDVSPNSNHKVAWICNEGHKWEAMVSQRTVQGENCTHCSNKRVLSENNLAKKFPNIAAQWHPTKNEDLRPEDVAVNSRKMVSWKCPKGHVWEGAIAARTSNGKGRDLRSPTHQKAGGLFGRRASCPYCFSVSAERLLNRRVLAEFSKLFGFKQVNVGLREPRMDVYLREHNIGIQIITYGPKESDEPQVRVKIADRAGTPITIFRLERSTSDEDHIVPLMALANSILEHEATSEEVRGILQTYVDSNALVNEEGYDHEIERMVRGRGPSPGASLGDIVDVLNEAVSRRKLLREEEEILGEGGRDTERLHEIHQKLQPSFFDDVIGREYRRNRMDWKNLKIEWDDEKNGDLTIYDVYPGSKKKVWWRCDKGHSWHAIIKNRTNGSGCPKCSRSRVGEGNDLASRIEEVPELSHLKQEWMNAKNVDEFGLTLSDVTPASNKNVWWKCENAGHEWEARIANRVNGTGCPICAGRKWKTTEAVRGVVDAADYDKVVPQIESVVNTHLQGEDRIEELKRELLQLEREKDILEQKLKLQQEVTELKKQIQEKGGD